MAMIGNAYRHVNATVAPALAAAATATPAPSTPAYTWPTALPDGRRLRPFGLVAAMDRRGLTVAEACRAYRVAEWQLRKMRIAGLATDEMVRDLSEPKYYLMVIRGADGLDREYRAYAHHDAGRGVRVWKLWRPSMPTYTVRETAGGVSCTCPDAEKHVHRGDYGYRCKHARALIAAEMVADVDYDPAGEPMPLDPRRPGGPVDRGMATMGDAGE